MNINEILECYKINELEATKFELYYLLFVQLIAYCNWLDFFRDSQFVILLTEFDRDYRTSPMVLAARQNNIPSITLVHGILNPPFAYVPVLADQIWCWGRFQKKQLIAFGVPEEKIQVVGNPIAKYYDLKNSVRNSDQNICIGIGLNPMSKEENLLFLNSFRYNDLSYRFNWIIKLHPSMKKTEWMEGMVADNFLFFETEDLQLEDFFNRIDLLIVSNSGLGYEAIVNNIPVWVYRVEEGQDGHDGVMIELGRCPDIRDGESLKREMDVLLNNKNEYLRSLIESERIFVQDQFYEAIGEEASQIIFERINEILKYVE